MLVTSSDLAGIAQARLIDAEVLQHAGRYDGAVYLCGYVVEIALKARICSTLGWPGFPSTRSEFNQHPFKGYKVKTHSFDFLLQLSGQEQHIKRSHFAEWSTVTTWDPDSRYKAIGSATATDADDMIDSARTLLAVL